jgi:hypothetical protein
MSCIAIDCVRSSHLFEGEEIAMPHEHEILDLEKKVSSLSNALAHLGSADDFRKLILILKRPGWTTPAELLLAASVVESMLAHVAALDAQKHALMKGAEAVVSGKAVA